MHLKRTKLASRVTRIAGWVGDSRHAAHIAKAIEHRGIITTYRTHDRVMSNRWSRRLYARAPAALDEVQRRVADALDEQDYAVVPFAELVPDEAQRAAVEDQGAAFAARTEEMLAREAAGEDDTFRSRETGKEFLVRLHGFGGRLRLDDPWLSLCLSRRMLDVANAYLRMWSKLEYVDLWYSVPIPGGSERVASQRWHRDYDDRHLLKVFLYLVDVDEEAGPFEFVPGSARQQPYAGLWPWYPLSQSYPSQEEVARRVPASAVRTFTAPKGTLIFCNTSGFHRGGFATGKPRVLATATYCSPASLASLTVRSFTLEGSRRALDGPARYALA